MINNTGIRLLFQLVREIKVAFFFNIKISLSWTTCVLRPSWWKFYVITPSGDTARISCSPLYREDDIMMTPNGDNKAGARPARTIPFAITKSIMKSADSAVITRQRVFTECAFPQRFRPRRNEKSARQPSSSDCELKGRLCTSEL